MADWGAFAGVAGVVTALVLLLARASAPLVSGGAASPAESSSSLAESTSSTAEPSPDAAWEGTEFETAQPADRVDGSSSSPVAPGDDDPPDRRRDPPIPDLSPVALLTNVTVTQGFFACFLLGGVWYAQVPLAALGVAVPTPADLALGVGFGVVLFGLNQVAANAGREFGLGGGEALREMLAPESALGWLLLLGVALPVVAGFEELLFRGALVGGLAAGFGVSPWLLAVGSSAAFGVGHGAQGRVGVVVTALLGFVFAAAFVLTGSLLVVGVAHYLVNALEFVVHEGTGWGPVEH